MDPEALAVELLGQRLTAHISTELPAKLADNLPAVQVALDGGPYSDTPWNGDRPLRYSPRLDFGCFAATREAAADLSEAVAAALFALRGTECQWGRITSVYDVSRQWRPDWNDNVRRYGVAASLSISPPRKGTP